MLSEIISSAIMLLSGTDYLGEIQLALTGL